MRIDHHGAGNLRARQGERVARRSRTQAERTALSEDRLLGAALRLISERGYDRTTLQAIGAEAGYSRGLVSHRFGSKEGLLWALLERMFGHWSTDSLNPAVGGQVGIAALHAAVEAMRHSVHARPERLRAFYALLFESLGPLPVLRPKVAEFHRRQRDGVARWIQDGIAAGTVRADVDAAAQAALFMSAIRGAAYQWLIDPEVDIDAIYDEIEATFARNLQRSST
jgi:AcrR family transcriptional regulator